MQFWPSMRRAMKLAALSLAGALVALPALAADKSAEPEKLDNDTCLTCHNTKAKKIEVPVAGGKTRALHGLPGEKFEDSVHGKMECTSCHAAIKDNAEKGVHAKDPALAATKPDCATCHQDLWQQTVKRGRTQEFPRLGVVAANIEAYRKSFHARPNADDKTHPNAKCDDCHDTHTFNVPAKNTPQYTQWRLSIAKTCGAECHTDQLDEYKDSVHGKENAKNMLAQAAVCSDCHTSHAISNTSGDPFKLTVSKNCGNCHKEELATYKETYHGSVNTLGYSYTAKCYDCHGSHGIKRVDDPESKVFPANRMKTCQTCHNAKKGLPDVPKAFATYEPHGNPHDFKRYPQIWAAFQLMAGLLIGTFAFFWVHTILWFWREYQERKARNGDHRVQLGEVGEHLHEKHVVRFTPAWRLAHIVFALSLMVLTLTGMPLFYPDVPWAPTIMHLLGGPKVTGTIHRTAAVVFAGIFFVHLVWVAIYIGTHLRTFKLFGPNSLIPNLKDMKDIVAMFKWFFGKGPRPKFDRWTYWEKFDYWAPFWGVTIIGVSGLVMWLPQFFGTFLPGWAFNVAAIFHGEEAFLAVVFLFTVHFFNNHFRPDKFPVEIVMFTGTLSLEEFKRDHAIEYQRLVETGELEKRLVEPPSAAKVKASKALGFTLIAVGLILLTLVGIGFFRG
jgi:cytochrome b subunit of formate dehydrogenase